MKVGIITEEESKEIKYLNGVRNSLEELLMILPKEDEMYDSVMTDLNLATQKYNKWWENTSEKYNWIKYKNGMWNLNFETRQVDLIISS